MARTSTSVIFLHLKNLFLPKSEEIYFKKIPFAKNYYKWRSVICARARILKNILGVMKKTFVK